MLTRIKNDCLIFIGGIILIVDMKMQAVKTHLASVTFAIIIGTLAASAQSTVDYPKNLARLHLGASLFEYNERSQTYEPTKSISSWMDDDEATGIAPKKGKRYYLLVLQKPSMIRALSLSADGMDGTISVFAGDERAVPGSASWAPLITGTPIAEINERVAADINNQFGRYLLIELDLTQSGPLWSLYVFGREAASEYSLERRAFQVNSSDIFGQKVKMETIIDLANIYSDASVLYTASGGKLSEWQVMIDESPETAFTMTGSASQQGPSFAILLNQSAPVKRISVMADAGRGKLEFYLIGGLADDEIFQVNIDDPYALPEFSQINLDELEPICVLEFDGQTDRIAENVADSYGLFLLGRWIPAVEGGAIRVRQVDAFGDLDFDNYEVVLTPEGYIAYDESAKSYKALLDPIAEGPLDGPPLDPAVLPPPIFLTPVPPLITVTPEDDPDPTPERPDPSSP